MAHSFSRQISFSKRSLLAVVVPQLRKDGMHYEVNMKGYPRFYMAWSALGRYDVVGTEPAVPYELILAVSDMLERERG